MEKQKFKVGDRVKVIGNKLEHDTPFGTHVRVIRYDELDNGYSCHIDSESNDYALWYGESDLAHLPKEYHIQEHYTTTAKLKWYAIPSCKGGDWVITDENREQVALCETKDICEMIVELYNKSI